MLHGPFSSFVSLKLNYDKLLFIIFKNSYRFSRLYTVNDRCMNGNNNGVISTDKIKVVHSEI